MPKLSDLLAEKAKADIQVGGSTVSFQFFVMVRERFSHDTTDDGGVVTPGEWTQLLAMSGHDYLKMLLPRVLVSWDLVDDDGHAVPVTADAIEQHHVPDVLLYAIERRVFNSDLSGKATSSNSLAT